MALRLSILDQSPVSEGCSAGDALRNTIDLARLADGLGYTRYWVAEHHGSAGLVCPSPEAMIGPIAAATSRLRVGSGGVMLPHYSPLKVAETFSMLSSLFPGRIDLGIGRSAGASPLFSYALQRDRRQPAPDDFRDQLDELAALLSNRPVPDTRFARLTSMHFESPEVWLLGSSQDSAVWAAELGLPYAFADFINPEGVTIARCYRERFCPSERLKTPRTSVAALAICADTDEEAERLSLGGGAPRGRRIFTGTPARVREALEQLARDYEAEEVLIVNIRQDHGARRRSYELISRAFCLNDRNG